MEKGDHEAKNAGNLKKLGQAREWIFPRTSRMEHSPANTLILAPETCVSLLTCSTEKRINLYEATKFVVICFNGN